MLNYSLYSTIQPRRLSIEKLKTQYLGIKPVTNVSKKIMDLINDKKKKQCLHEIES